MTKYKIILMAICSLVSSALYAAQGFVTLSPDEVIAGMGYVGVRVTGNLNDACYFSPLNTSMFVKPATDTDASAVQAILLTAQTTGKNVYIRFTDDITVDITNRGVTHCNISYVTITK